jgi:signal transduction histidine kinase
LSTGSLLEQLSSHHTVGSVPPDQIVWMAEHGKLRHLNGGDVLTSKNGPVDGLHVVLNGHLSIHVDRGAGRRKIMEWRGGDVTGFLPYSRLVAPPGDVVAEEPTDVVTIYRDCIPEMTRQCYELTAVLVHVMVDRARHFTASYFHDEKLVSLGKLAAGLAHELNNPASATARSAKALSASFLEVDAAARFLGAAGLTGDQVAAVEKVRDACLAGGLRSVLSPLEQEAREDAIAAWLEGHQADAAAAEELAETDVTFEMLDRVASSVPGPAFNAALRWLAAGCAAGRLTAEIQEASSRIYGLVGAIKGFTEMDRESVPEPVELGRGLADTLVVLRAKAKGKLVGLSLNVEEGLPCVNGFGGELNQVWANLIDNALDAVSEGGRVEVSAARQGDTVVVRVVDDGGGVPPEVRDRIFDPFFSTKPPGKGTGLGLDIVRRLVQRHSGEIELDSGPGRTEFRVKLPVVLRQGGER